MATPTKPKGDLITQLQLELNHVSELLFATVAELQRDAGPVAINDEAIVTSEQKAAYNVAERSKGFAAEILATHSSIDQLISKLPAALVPEGEQLATISELQQQAAELQVHLVSLHALTAVQPKCCPTSLGSLVSIQAADGSGKPMLPHIPRVTGFHPGADARGNPLPPHIPRVLVSSRLLNGSFRPLLPHIPRVKLVFHPGVLNVHWLNPMLPHIPMVTGFHPLRLTAVQGPACRHIPRGHWFPSRRLTAVASPCCPTSLGSLVSIQAADGSGKPMLPHTSLGSLVSIQAADGSGKPMLPHIPRVTGFHPGG
eukprot:gene3575-13653_t